MGKTAQAVLETVNPVEPIAKAFREEVLHADLVAAMEAKERTRTNNVVGINGNPLIIDDSVAEEPEQGELLLEQPLEASTEATEQSSIASPPGLAGSDSVVEATQQPKTEEPPVAPPEAQEEPIPLVAVVVADITEADDTRAPLAIPATAKEPKPPRKPWLKPILAKVKAFGKAAGKVIGSVVEATGIAIVGFLVSLFFVGVYLSLIHI